MAAGDVIQMTHSTKVKTPSYYTYTDTTAYNSFEKFTFLF